MLISTFALVLPLYLLDELFLHKSSPVSVNTLCQRARSSNDLCHCPYVWTFPTMAQRDTELGPMVVLAGLQLWCIVVALHVLAVSMQCFRSAVQRHALSLQYRWDFLSFSEWSTVAGDLVMRMAWE